MAQRQLFWLHIKKSAGITTRSLLQPYYTEVERGKVNSFDQAEKKEYNDILNNYRTNLGEYQLKRCQFAEKYLYPGTWEEMFSFAFAREPVDRCVSMFYYLYYKERGLLANILRSAKLSIRSMKLLSYNSNYAFDTFLECVGEAHYNNSIKCPHGHHFTTHTAPMWGDITDPEGKILLSQVYRLDNLIEGINAAYEQCGIPQKVEKSTKRLNQNNRRKSFSPSKEHKRKIGLLYEKDYQVYEESW
jgi:hypothetical protein